MFLLVSKIVARRLSMQFGALQYLVKVANGQDIVFAS
jgi:hypothetical protein